MPNTKTDTTGGSNWSGPYIGAQFGYSFANFSSYSTNLVGTFPVPFDQDVDLFRGGAYAGYNIQLGRFMLGLEADITFGAGSGERESPAYGVVYNAKTKSDWDGSLRLRFGYASGSLLFYGTGGVAFGNVATDYGCIGCVNAATASYRVADTRVGWAVGGGLEYAMTNAVSVRLDYRYTDLGDKTEIFPSPIVAISHDNSYTSSQIAVGLTYRFH